ncbi:small ribosomal subunit protein mS38 [Salvelinus sp. IW2-2015]|uniref:small ribosomal subunit protein mS38 n=1 Tax=Salvelinus sp. IW2-2015 TaxID=2691554 RepID=UPI0038D38E41
MNRHKYKKLLKRTKFPRRRVLDGRREKNQKHFEMDLQRIWMRAGLKKSPGMEYTEDLDASWTEEIPRGMEYTEDLDASWTEESQRDGIHRGSGCELD